MILMKILASIFTKGSRMFKNLAKPDETIVEHTKECLDVAKNLVFAFEKEIERFLSTDKYKGKEIFFPLYCMILESMPLLFRKKPWEPAMVFGDTVMKFYPLSLSTYWKV